MFNKLKIKKHDQRKIYKILIADDESDISNLFRNLLEQRGHNVTFVFDSIDCINKCQNAHYDIIFIDLHMKQFDGIYTTDLIRELYGKQSLIFAFTVDNSNNALNDFKVCGMNGAVIKPFDIELINKMMNSIELIESVNKEKLSYMKKIKSNNKLFIFD
jgi:CheY-like chemotaxis protein